MTHNDSALPSAAPLDLDALLDAYTHDVADMAQLEFDKYATAEAKGNAFRRAQASRFALVAAARRVVEDTERLDWLEAQRVFVTEQVDANTQYAWPLWGNVRQRIDERLAARAALPTEDADAK